MTAKSPVGGVVQPLIAAAFAGVGGAAATSAVPWTNIGEAGAFWSGLPISFIERLASSGLMLVQVGVFFAGLVYGLFAWAIAAAAVGRSNAWTTRLGGGAIKNDAALWDRARHVRLSPLLFAAWLLPVLGFIGTVVGISGSLGPLGEGLSQSNGAPDFGAVLSNLQTAFDTTLVGLIGAIPVTALSFAVDSVYAGHNVADEPSS